MSNSQSDSQMQNVKFLKSGTHYYVSALQMLPIGMQQMPDETRDLHVIEL